MGCHLTLLRCERLGGQIEHPPTQLALVVSSFRQFLRQVKQLLIEHARQDQFRDLPGQFHDFFAGVPPRFEEWHNQMHERMKNNPPSAS